MMYKMKQYKPHLFTVPDIIKQCIENNLSEVSYLHNDISLLHDISDTSCLYGLKVCIIKVCIISFSYFIMTYNIVMFITLYLL